MVLKLILTLIVISCICVVLFHHSHIRAELYNQVVADRRLIKESMEKMNSASDSTRVVEAFSTINASLQTLYDLNSRYGQQNAEKITGVKLEMLITDAEKLRDVIYDDLVQMYPKTVRSSTIKKYKTVQYVEDSESETSDDDGDKLFD